LLQRSDVRLLTLTGPPGIGKTRLSLAVAACLRDRFADGVAFIPLAPVSISALVLPMVAQRLGVQDGGGVPLLFSPQELLARLDWRLELLTAGAPDLPVRQQTLRGAIAWSYHLLGELEQALFRHLGVFIDGCTLEAVEQVCLAPDSNKLVAIDGITALVDHSVLQRSDGVDGTPRFAMLETLREYALEQLKAAGEVERAQTRHLAYYLARVEEAALQLGTPDEQIWLDRLEHDHDNLRAALAWAVDRDPQCALRLGGALTDFWRMRGHLSEGRQWLERVLTAVGTPSHTSGEPASRSGSVPLSAAYAKALHGAGMLAHTQGDDVRAQARKPR
jgi:predicted ATPase